MAGSITKLRPSGTPLVMVADRFDNSPSGRTAMALAHWASGMAGCEGRGAVRAVLWTTGPDGWARPPGLLVREIEDINSWALARELVRLAPTRAVGRALRAARVRSWWTGLGPSPAVVLADGHRDELPHYLPPTTRAIVGPDLMTDAVTEALWARALRRRFGVPDGSRLIGGWGPPAWSAGIDQFLAAAARPELTGDHFVWLLPRSTPMAPEPVHDARALGIEERFHWCEAPGDPADALVGCDVVVAAGRAVPVDLGSLRGRPTVAYGTEAVPAAGARPEQLAAAVDRIDRRGGLLRDEDLAALIDWVARP